MFLIFTVWGYARIAKSDNKSYILVVTCVSHEKPSWVVLHKKSTISDELREEILGYIETLGFDGNELSSPEDPITLSKIGKSKC